MRPCHQPFVPHLQLQTAAVLDGSASKGRYQARRHVKNGAAGVPPHLSWYRFALTAQRGGLCGGDVCLVVCAAGSGGGAVLLEQERADTQHLRRGTDEEVDRIMKQLSDLTYESEQEADYEQ